MALPALCGYLAATAYYWYDIYACLAVPPFTRDMFSMLVLAVFLILLMSVYVFTYPKWHANQIMGTFFGVFYNHIQCFIDIFYFLAIKRSACFLKYSFTGSICT